MEQLKRLLDARLDAFPMAASDRFGKVAGFVDFPIEIIVPALPSVQQRRQKRNPVDVSRRFDPHNIRHCGKQVPGGAQVIADNAGLNSPRPSR